MPSTVQETAPTSVINVDEFSKTYDGSTVVDRISFSVEEGEVFAILGPNGASKTTTVESVAGLRTPDAARIHVFGFDPLRDRDRVASLLGASCSRAASRTA